MKWWSSGKPYNILGTTYKEKYKYKDKDNFVTAAGARDLLVATVALLTQTLPAQHRPPSFSQHCSSDTESCCTVTSPRYYMLEGKYWKVEIMIVHCTMYSNAMQWRFISSSVMAAVGRSDPGIVLSCQLAPLLLPRSIANVFVTFFKCICHMCQMYLFELLNIFVKNDRRIMNK